MRKKLLSLLVLVMEAYGVLPSYGKMELKETLERGDWNVLLYVWHFLYKKVEKLGEDNRDEK